MDTASAQQSVK